MSFWSWFHRHPQPKPIPAPAPTPPANTMPVGDIPGWKQVYAEDFNTPATLGNVLSTYPDVGAYPYATGWEDTSKKGHWCPERTMTVSNGNLNINLHYDSSLQQFMVCAVTPRHPKLTYGKIVFRLKADRIPGYKIAPLLWPDSDKWVEGELDFPESNLDGSVSSAFAHHTGNPTQQDQFSSGVNPDQWHTYEIQWVPGRVTFLVDGKQIGSTTNSVPSTGMHFVIQCETEIEGGNPPVGASGNVSVDWVAVYSTA